jgi:hypothetical protein
MTDNDYRDELHRVIRLVRNRYRLRVLLTGVVIFLVGAFVLLVFSAILLEQFKFDATAVVATRIGFYLALGGLLLRYLVLPLTRRLSDADIALYIETHEPSLQAALLSAVEYDARSAGDAPALVRRLLRQAVERARAIEDGRRIEQRPLRWLPAALTGSVALLVLAALFGPPFLRTALRVLLTPWGSAEAAAPYAVMVEPGNTVVPRGGDLRITARLRGFESDQVLLHVRVVDSTTRRPDGQTARRIDAEEWEITSMGEGTAPGSYTAQLFDLEQPADYYVEANGIRSPVFRLDVRDLPYTKRIDLEYRFPAYTGLPVQRIQDGGDVAALRGTRVTIRVTSTMPAVGGELVIEGRPPIPLVAGDSGVLAGVFAVEGNGFYHIELLGVDSPRVRASLDYAIESLGDQLPLVEIVRPGRDTRVTSLEEVFIEARGEDDFGVQRLELVYSVNGGPEKTVQLHGQGARRLKDVSAGHTLFLEEYELEPGDIVSYYARAFDANPFGGPGTAATDIYFLQVRPFDREYREAEQAGMPGQQDDSPEGLSEQQKEIVSATYKANRDRTTTPPSELRENLATISLAQGRMRQQVETLSRRMLQRGVSTSDSTFAEIAAELPLAIQAMREAEDQLGRREPDDALPPEQRALQHLQRAEAAYREVQVSRGGQPGGGGGQPPSNAEDLADLFELENDRRQNQYETVQRPQEEQQRQEMDEVMERLKQLASRQQQENERMLREAERMRQPGGASGGSASQRRLAQEVDSLTRRLERLSRERPTPEVQQSLRRLQEAADAMRRSAAQPSQSGGQGTRALDRIEEARRLLEQGNAARIRQNLEQSAERARRLAEQQREVARQAAGLAPDDAATRRRLEQAKDRMAGDVQSLENDLERAARDARREQREASRQIQEAVNDLRERRVRDKIEYSKGLLGSRESSRQFEEGITANLDELGRQLSEAAQAVGERQGERTERSLDRARALAQGLESLAERARQAQGQQPGSEGQGQQGQQGQQAGGQANGSPRQGTLPESTQGEETSGDAQPGTPGGRMRGSDPRQLGRELRERRMDAERLRRELEQEGVDVSELDRILSRMRGLEGRGLGSDTRAVDLLQSQVIEGLKEFEFALRRQLTGNDDRRPRSGRQGEVPAEYRELVDRYYESLSD